MPSILAKFVLKFGVFKIRAYSSFFLILRRNIFANMLFRLKDTIQTKTSLGNLFHLVHILALLFFRKIHRKKYSFCLRSSSYFLSDSASPICGILSGGIHFGSYSLGYCLQHTRMLWIHVESIPWLIRWNYWFWRGLRMWRKCHWCPIRSMTCISI